MPSQTTAQLCSKMCTVRTLVHLNGCCNSCNSYDFQSVFYMYFQSVIVLRLAIVAYELRTLTLIDQLMF